MNQVNQGLQNIQAEFWLSNEPIVHRNVSAGFDSELNYVSVFDLFEQLTNTLHNFFSHESLLDLRKLKYN